MLQVIRKGRLGWGEVSKHGTVRHRKTATGRESDVTGHILIATKISQGLYVNVTRYTGYDKKYSIFFKYLLTLRRRIKSHLLFAGIIRSSPFSLR